MLNRNYGNKSRQDPPPINPYINIDETGWPVSFTQKQEGTTANMQGGGEPSTYDEPSPPSESIGLWALLPYFALIFLAFMIHYIMFRPCRDCKNLRINTENPAALCPKHAVPNERTEMLKKNRATPYSIENSEMPARFSQDSGMQQTIPFQIPSNPPVLGPIPSDTMGRRFSLTIDSAAWIRRYNEDNPANQPEMDEMELQPMGGSDLPEPIRPPTENSAFPWVPPSTPLQRSGNSVPQGNSSFVPPSDRTQQTENFNANLEMPRMDDDASMSNNQVLETGVPDVRNVLTEVVTKLNEGIHEYKKKKTCASQERNLNVLVEKIKYEQEEGVDTSEDSIEFSLYCDETPVGMTGVRKRTANNSRLGSNVNVSPVLGVDEDAESLNRRLGSHEPLLDSVTDLVQHLVLEPKGIDDNRTKQDIERLSGSVLEGGVRQVIEGPLNSTGGIILQNTPAKTRSFSKYSPGSRFIPIDMEFLDSPIEAASNIATASSTSFESPPSSLTPQSKASMEWDGAVDNHPQPSTSGTFESSMALLCRPPCGLVNVHGASCYVNAGLQLLAAVPQFEEAVLQALRTVPPHAAPAATLFVQFLEDRRHSDKIAPTGILDYLFGKHTDKFVGGVQADSEEFVYTLLLDIHEELFMTPSNPVETLFRGQQVVETNFGSGHRTVKSSMFQTLVLHVLRHCTLEHCLDHYTAEHWDEEFSTQTRALLSRLPPLLLLRLQSYDSSGCKTYNKINLGDTINFRTEWMTPQLANSSVGPRYRMRSVIFHTGLDTDSGHYTAAVCQTPSPDLVVWYYCDDSKVTQTDFVTIENIYTMNHPQLVLLERITADN